MILRLDHGWRFDAGHRLDLPPAAGGVPAATPSPSKPKTKANTQTNRSTMDFIPRKRTDRKEWYKNIRDNVETAAVAAGIPAADATAAKNLAGDIYTALDETDTAGNVLDGKRSTERSTETAKQAQLRAKIRNWKTLPGYAGSGLAGTLQLAGEGAEFDGSSYKPVFTVRMEGGHVRFDFQLLGADGLAFYRRLRGQTTWTKMGTDTDPPYFDSRPVATPGTPEAREYMARGLTGDDEIGEDSDVVEFTVPGKQ